MFNVSESFPIVSSARSTMAALQERRKNVVRDKNCALTETQHKPSHFHHKLIFFYLNFSNNL